MRKIRLLVRTFTNIMTAVVFEVAVFTTVINPIDKVETKLFWQMALVSALCTLTALIYPWNREMGKTEAMVKILIHYVFVNVIVLSGGAFFHWYNPFQLRSIAAMALAIALIFGAISLCSWRKLAVEAARMNEKLEEYQNKANQ